MNLLSLALCEKICTFHFVQNASLPTKYLRNFEFHWKVISKVTIFINVLLLKISYQTLAECSGNPTRPAQVLSFPIFSLTVSCIIGDSLASSSYLKTTSTMDFFWEEPQTTQEPDQSLKPAISMLGPSTSRNNRREHSGEMQRPFSAN